MRTLALHQWRRNKGAFLGFGATILIAACMLGSALTLLFTVGPRYTALADELHTADVDIVVPRTAATADVRDVIDHTTGVAAVDPHDRTMAEEAARLCAFVHHRPLHPDSMAYRSECAAMIARMEAFSARTKIDFSEEIASLKRNL